MTWYFEAYEQWIDVWDHNGDLVAEHIEFSGVWEGDFPKEVYAVMRDAVGDGQPSRYNQLLIADAAMDNIEEGRPPGAADTSRQSARPMPADETTDRQRSQNADITDDPDPDHENDHEQ